VSASATPVANFESLLAQGKDGPLLRFALGNEYLKAGDAVRAAEHLARAAALDPEYTAAWKLLGRALAQAGRDAEALDAFAKGIDVAARRGDKQAQKEMQVFARRIERALRGS
jgi:predicted Zn-dependent protease